MDKTVCLQTTCKMFANSVQPGGGETLALPKEPDNDNWKLFLARVAIIHVKGSPSNFSLKMISDALEKIGGLKYIDRICSLERGHKWQVRFITNALRDEFLRRYPFLEVMPEYGGTVQCATTTFFDNIKIVKVKNVPGFLPSSVIMDRLEEVGHGSCQRNKCRWERSKTTDGSHIQNGTLLIPFRSTEIENLPDELCVSLDADGLSLDFVLNIVVIGLPPRCFACKERGHMIRECTNYCSVCRTTGHSTDQHESLIESPTLKVLYEMKKTTIPANIIVGLTHRKLIKKYP